MEQSMVVLAMSAERECDEQVEVMRDTVVTLKPAITVIPDRFEQVRGSPKRTAYIDFIVNRTDIRADYHHNERELATIAHHRLCTGHAHRTYLGTSGRTRAGQVGEIGTNSVLNGTGATTAGTEKKVNGFGVFAYNTESSTWESAKASAKPNFMYNQLVTYSTNAWTYSPVKYWPNGKDAANEPDAPSNTATEGSVQNLSFFAYAPYAYVSTTGSNIGKEKVSSATDGYDMIGAGETQQGTKEVGITAISTNTTAGGPVISYALPATPSGKNSVDLLWGLAGKATYAEADGGNATKTVGTDYNTDLTKQTVSEDVKFLFKHALAKIDAIKVVADIDGNGAGESGFGTKPDETLITVSSVSIKPESASSNQVYKSVVRTYDANLDPETASGGEGTWSKVSQTIINNVTLPQLAPNKKYTLVMHLGLNSVKFSAEVGEWDGTSETKEVWLPSNVVDKSTETTIAAGSSVTVNAASTATAYTIHLTGLQTTSNSVTATASPVATADPTVTYSTGQETATITVIPMANGSTTATKANTITIEEKNGDTVVTTTVVNIVQAKAVTP